MIFLKTLATVQYWGNTSLTKGWMLILAFQREGGLALQREGWTLALVDADGLSKRGVDADVKYWSHK